MNTPPLVVNLFGGPCSGRHDVAARVLIALRQRGVRTKLIVAEGSNLSALLVPSVAEQWAQAHAADREMRTAVKQGYAVVLMGTPFLLDYLKQPCLFESSADERAVLDQLVALHRSRPTFDVMLTRALSQADRDARTGHLTDSARSTLALEAQIMGCLDACGLRTHVIYTPDESGVIEALVADILAAMPAATAQAA